MSRRGLLALTLAAACHEPRRDACLVLPLEPACPDAAEAESLFDEVITWEEDYVVLSGPERWPTSTCDDDTDSETAPDGCEAGPAMSCCYRVEVYGD